MFKIFQMLILCCISTMSYASLLGPCGTTRYSIQDLKELDKQELTEEYCSGKESLALIEDSEQKASEAKAFGLLESKFNEAMLCSDNLSVIERSLLKKHKVKTNAIKCESLAK